MKFRQTKISAAIILATSFAATPVMADWTTDSATIDVIIQAKANDSIEATANVEFTLTVIPSQALGANDTVTFTLTGGAKFATNATPVLLFQSNGAGAFFSGFSFDGFSADRTEITFTTGNSPIDGDDILRLNTDLAGAGALFDLTGVAEGVDVDIQITTKKPNGDIKNQMDHISLDATMQPLFSGENLLVCAENTSRKDTVDVATTFANYVVATPPSSMVGTPLAWTLTPADVIVAEELVIKMEGSVNGLTSVSATDFTGAVDATGDQTGGALDLFLLDTTASNFSYASNTADTIAATALTMVPTFTIDGTTTQEARTFSFSAEVIDSATWTGHTVDCSVEYEIKRNGSSFSMNSFGPLNTLKISDTSGNIPAGSGTIQLMGWTADGTSIASTLTPDDLSSNGTVIISGPDIIASLPGGVQRIDVTVESESIKASSVKADPTTGFKTTTVYTNQEDVGAL